MKKINTKTKYKIFTAIVTFILFASVIYLSSFVMNSQRELIKTKEELAYTNTELDIQKEAYYEVYGALTDALEELSESEQTIADFKKSEYEFVYMGDFKITHYCKENYNHICGNGNGLTATGTQITVGKTIAVDPKVIPYGSVVYIQGYGFRTAEDCGGSVDDNHIDVAVTDHATAMASGVKHKDVWLLVKKTS